ncbi:putative wall-associated receptor kinase-like 16 [Macadamia integrifolia]|uniref:putative wall-associated receptor kinase-like 16 n=1 Tax=Macadamia integrifolia TaxID=60698 RepID=UPI001C4F8D4E|nr:putative wall-associated receptor kinase-like 16 [Macadamia integrifolia]
MMDHLMLLRFLFFILLLWLAVVATSSTLPMAKPHCKDKCGNIHVPYPFGFGDKDCYRDESFQVSCNDTYKPPKLFLKLEDYEVQNLSLQGILRVLFYVIKDCYSNSGQLTDSFRLYMKKSFETFTFSDTQNKFMALGCDTKANIQSINKSYVDIQDSDHGFFQSGCSMMCNNISDVIINGSCTGVGCCETSIPKGFGYYDINLGSFDNHRKVHNFNPCSYAFLVDKNWFNLSVSDLLNFTKNVDEYGFSRVPVVLDWTVDNKTCEEAMKKKTTYACGNNSRCIESKNGIGYSCNCSQGYHGNPYLSDGCQDIDECKDRKDNTCSSIKYCFNLPGGYKCSCPPGYHGDAKKDGTGCIPATQKPYQVIQDTIGAGLGFLFLVVGILSVLCALQKRKDNKLKQKFFRQNGGFLLKQQLSSSEGPVEPAKIFTAEELKKASNNYAQSQILGRGGYGTVYKGVLPNHRNVAIKKSRKVDENQIEQFINEVVILSQINHRNVVKLLGCCLETEVPILVYEFVTNKTLFYHIHGEGCNSPISWDNRLRIAAETSEALAYLHSAATPPIIHRDIKSANILLDDNYTAKVSDFGASRLVPLDQAQISTLVQGTLGYLDPEYLRSSQLTEKSDVYSFGVVLVELLTGKKALNSDGYGRESNLAMHFVTSIEEGRVWEILDNQIVTEGCREKLQVVLELAERCLRLKGEERPTMKEVAMELQGLRRDQTHPWIAQNPEEVECLIGEPLVLPSHNTIEYNSLTNEALISLDGGR